MLVNGDQQQQHQVSTPSASVKLRRRNKDLLGSNGEKMMKA